MSLLLLDVTLPSPEENLALDEALLRECAAPAGGGEGPREALRLWESPLHFAALGVSGKLREEVDAAACARERVPVLRRASGGGTVLLGPGCLCFSLVLSLDARPALCDLYESFRAILARAVEALGIPGVLPSGISDLALSDRKFSGNAQKRTRGAVLHQGTILHAFDLARIPRLLREPGKQPEYRRRRSHLDFLANLPLPGAEIRRRLAAAWEAEPPARRPILPPLEDLIREKYGNPAWTERF